MSWPTWSAAAAPIPTAVAASVQSTLLPTAINSAPAVLAPMGYSQEQWAQAQQQNWQQWAQWQQQYQQWHQQYGAEYQKSINAMQGALSAPVQVQPPLPAMAAAVQAPPLPTDNKPPLPPDEPPMQPQAMSSLSAYPSTPGGYSTTTAPPLMPQSFPLPNQMAMASLYQSQPQTQAWQTQTQAQKRPHTQDVDYDQAKRAMIDKTNQWNQQKPQQHQWQQQAANPTFNQPPPLAQQQPQQQAQQQTQAAGATAKGVEELSEAEKKFDKEFAAWEAQFNRWKEQNANHPDKTQYREYEKKWESWRNSLLERREQMRRKRLALTGQAATPAPAPAPVSAQKPQIQGPVVNQAAPNTSPVPAQPQPTSKPSLLGAYPGDTSMVPQTDLFNKPPPNQNNEPLSFKNKHNFSESSPASGEGFLAAGASSGGIPGLDLVKDDAKEDLPDRSEIVEKVAEDIETPKQKVPDLEAISKGINSILGDQKLLSMLSMVSQNAPPPGPPANVSTNTTSNIMPNFAQNFGMPPPNFQQFPANNNFGAPPPIFDYANQNQNKPNKDDFFQQQRFDGPPPEIRNNFNTAPPPFAGRDAPPDQFARGPAPVAAKTTGDNFARGTGDNFARGLGDNFARGPGDNFARGPGDNFARGPGDNFNRGTGDSFARGGGDNFNRGSADNFARKGGDNFSQGLGDSFARGSNDNLGRGVTDNFARGAGNFGDKLNQFEGGFRGRNENVRNSRFDNEDEDNRKNSYSRDNFGGNKFGRTDSFNRGNELDDDYDNYNEEEDYDKYNDMFRDDEDDQYRDDKNNYNDDNDRYRDDNDQYYDDNNDYPQQNKPRPLMSQPIQQPKIPSLMDLTPAPPQIQPLIPIIEPPAPDDDPIFEPVTVIDYDHQSKTKNEDVYVVPNNMYDYNHKPVNCIPHLERPKWLAETVKFIREFDPQVVRYERVPSITDKRLFPDAGRDDSPHGRFDGRDRYRRERSFEKDDFYRSDRGRDNRGPRDRDRGSRGDRDSRGRDRSRGSREDRFRSGDRDNFRNENSDRQRSFDDKMGNNLKNKPPPREFEELSDNEMDFEQTEQVRHQQDTETRSKSRSPELSNPPNPSAKQIEITMIEDIINAPGRFNRPPRIVIILRGPPGSGKTFLAKQIKDKEVENGGSAPRILSLDDYFMVEHEKKVMEDGKMQTVKEMVYEYEAEMEESYRQSFMKSFKKTITDGFFAFIIVDNVNDKVKYFGEMWSFAKQNGFQVYVCQMDLDPVQCTKRNIHNRSEKEIEDMIAAWEPTPAHHPTIDASGLLQMCAIADVEMEVEEPTKELLPEETKEPEPSSMESTKPSSENREPWKNTSNWKTNGNPRGHNNRGRRGYGGPTWRSRGAWRR